MADNVKSILIYTTPGGVFTPTTSGSYDLRVSPFASSGISGTHQSGGVWNFTGIDDTAAYKLYDTAGGIEVTSYTGGGTNTRSFYDISLQSYIRKDGTIAFAANQPVGGFKFTGLGAGSTNGDSVRWEQALLTTGNQTKSTGVLTFQDNYPIMSWTATYTDPTDQNQLAPKKYVDDRFSGATGVVQSTYLIKCLPTRSTLDIYSRTTVEACNTYLAALSNITTCRGTIYFENSGNSVDSIDLDDGTLAWCSNGVDLYSVNRVRLNRRAPNPSLTSTTRLNNIYILDNNVVATRTYVNFGVKDCLFVCNGATNLTFDTVTFRGITSIRMDSGTLTLANCKGNGIRTNAAITYSGSTRPTDVLEGLDLNNMES